MRLTNLFSKVASAERKILFYEIIGYDHIKRLFRMVLDCGSVVHILLVGLFLLYFLSTCHATSLFIA
jgi:hypothetical protein